MKKWRTIRERQRWKPPQEFTNLLLKLMQDEDVKIENGEYIGRASDGEWVSLGTVGDEIALAEYLLTHRTPNTW